MRSSALFPLTSLCLVMLLSIAGYSQSVGIGTNTPDGSALLDIKSSNKGILVPRTSTGSRLAILNPAKGLMLYDTTTSSFWFHNGSGWVQIGAANGWALTGNGGINPATNFLGTTDNLPLRFKVNNSWAGELHPTNGNIFLGVGAGLANTTAGKNTAIGDSALQNQSFNYGGETNNVAIGSQALALNNPTSTGNGISNTAIGSFALRNNTIGFDNTAVGASALYYNETGRENTAIGRQALFSNTNGVGNTATGYKALRFNNYGIDNTANGAEALNNNIASYNTANGYRALYSNAEGNSNTANGYEALHNNTIGDQNTVNGYKALYSNTTGYYNTAIGAIADFLYPNLFNSTAIGYNAKVDDFNKVRIGNTEVQSIGGHVDWTAFSDGRFKQQVQEDVKGLEFIELLRPVTYIVDLPGLNNYYEPNKKNTGDSKSDALQQWMQQSHLRAATHRESGFIAQEVEQAANKTGFTFSGVDKPANDKALYGLRYGAFVVPLVKAVQELLEQTNAQNKIIEQQQNKIAQQQQQYEILLKRVEALEKKN